MFNRKSKKSKYNTTNNYSFVKDSVEYFDGLYSGYSSVPKPKKVQPKKSNRGVVTVYFLFFILVSIYILGCGYGFITKKVVNYDVVQMGVIDTPKTVQGVIVRDEKVYKTSAAGVINYEVADNERVKKNTEVCTIKDAEAVKALEDELNTINEKIIKLQAERSDISVYSDDVKNDNREIQSLIDDNAMDYAKQNFGNIYELKNVIQKKMDTRNDLLLTENKGTMTDLVTQRNEQLTKLNNNISKISVEEGGIVSYSIDGYEDKYTIAGLGGYSEKDTKITASASNTFMTEVESGTPAFKLVKSNAWYIACYIPSEYVKDWEEGRSVFIYAKDSLDVTHELPALIYDLNGSETDKERYCVLKITKDMEDFIDDRSITFDTEKSTSGYKIPNSAIMEETLLKIPYSYVNVEDNYVTKQDGTKVTVIVSDKDEDNDIAYVPVQLGVLNVNDTIVSSSGQTFKIEDVLNTKGIYVMNTGYAEFKRIYTEGSVSNNTHTILDVGNNPNIFIYDRIVTDTESVKREEKVY